MKRGTFADSPLAFNSEVGVALTGESVKLVF